MSAFEDLIGAIQLRHYEMGAPSARALAERIYAAGGAYSPAGANDVISGRRLSRWPTVKAVLQAMEISDDDLEPWRARWHAAHLERRTEGGAHPTSPYPAPGQLTYLAMMAEDIRSIRRLLERLVEGEDEGLSSARTAGARR